MLVAVLGHTCGLVDGETSSHGDRVVPGVTDRGSWGQGLGVGIGQNWLDLGNLW